MDVSNSPGVSDRGTPSILRAAGNVPMNSVLEQLYRLQNRIQFVRSRVHERDTVPAELIEVDREFREKVETVEKLRARLAEAGPVQVSQFTWARAGRETVAVYEEAVRC